MPTTIKYGKVTVTVRRATVEDDLYATVIERKLREDEIDGTWGVWPTFARLCSQTIASEGLDFSPVDICHASKEDMKTAYAVFMKCDKRLRDKWLAAVNKEDAPLEGEDPNP